MCMCVVGRDGVHAKECWCLRRPDEGVVCPGAGVRGSCESPEQMLGINKYPGPLREQSVPVAAELCLQPWDVGAL